MPHYEDYIPTNAERILTALIGCFIVPFVVIGILIFLIIWLLEIIGLVDMGKPEDFETTRGC